MKTFLLAAGLLLAACATDAAQASRDRTLKERVLYADYGYGVRPVWIPLEIAFEGGRLNRAVFKSIDNYEDGLALYSDPIPGSGKPLQMLSDADCEERFSGAVGMGEPYKQLHDFEEIVANAAAIYSGKVVAAAPGFLSTTPGTLLTLSIDDRHRDSEHYDVVSSTIRIYVPYARFSVDRYVFCQAPGNRPQVGDRMIVFAMDKPIARGIVIPGVDGMVYATSDGAVMMGPGLRDSAPPESLTSIAAIEREVRARVLPSRERNNKR